VRTSRPPAETASALIIGTLLAESLEDAEFGIFVYDDEGRYIAVNRRGAEILGYDRDDVMTRNVGDFTPGPLDRRVLYSRGVRQGTRTVRRKDGTDVTVAFVVAPTDVGRLPHRVAIVWETATTDLDSGNS
jgi:PAS domain S-box-containing protein